MMKRIFSVIVILCAGVLARAQSGETTGQLEPNRGSSESRFFRRIIPEAAAIFSDYRGNDATHYISKNGYSVGALVDMGTMNNLVLESGLLYRQLNASTDNSFGGAQYTYNYISLPLALKYYFAGQENSSFYLKVGGLASTPASRSNTAASGASGTVYNYNSRDFELSGLAALGGKFYLTPGIDLAVEGGYSRATESLFSNADVYNAAWNFSAGVAITL